MWMGLQSICEQKHTLRQRYEDGEKDVPFTEEERIFNTLSKKRSWIDTTLAFNTAETCMMQLEQQNETNQLLKQLICDTQRLNQTLLGLPERIKEIDEDLVFVNRRTA